MIAELSSVALYVMGVAAEPVLNSLNLGVTYDALPDALNIIGVTAGQLPDFLNAMAA